MAVTVSATAVGASSPLQVQVEVNGLVVDDSVLLEGILGDFTWQVRGGDFVATSTQHILRDALAPINAEITYRATVNGSTYTDTVTVTYSADYAFCPLEGGNAVGLKWVATPDPLTMYVDRHVSRIHGRRRGVLRYAPAGGETGVLEAVTETASVTESLRSLLASGAPIVVRTSGDIGDILPVRVISCDTNVRELINPGQSVHRQWAIPWDEIDDPLQEDAASGALFSHVNTVLDDQTGGGLFSDFNTYMTTLADTNFEDANRHDWEGAAS